MHKCVHVTLSTSRTVRLALRGGRIRCTSEEEEAVGEEEEAGDEEEEEEVPAEQVLLLGARHGELDYVQRALDVGVPVDHRDEHGNTGVRGCLCVSCWSELHSPAANANVRARKISFSLTPLSLSLSPPSPTFPAPLLLSALHFAAANGHVPILQLLLEQASRGMGIASGAGTGRGLPEAGTGVAARNLRGNTPLHWSVENQHWEATKILAER
jgi:hypothetical protein